MDQESSPSGGDSQPDAPQTVRVRADSPVLSRYAVGGPAGAVELQFLRTIPPALGRYAAGATSIWYHHASPPYPDSEPGPCDLQDGRPCYQEAGLSAPAHALHDAWHAADCDDETIWHKLEELYDTGLAPDRPLPSPPEAQQQHGLEL